MNSRDYLYMKRVISLILSLIIIVCIFASCSKSESVTFYYPVSDNAQYLDPQIADSTAERIISANCFEGLVRLDENGDIQPGAAEKTEVSSDGLTYTFTLRPDAKLHVTKTAQKKLGDKLGENFAPSVTANDFVFALRRVVDPTTQSPDASLFNSIKNASKITDGQMNPQELGVRAVSDTVLEITLEYADSDLLYALTRPAAMPCNETFFNACSGRYGLALEYMLCNGPFFVYTFSEDAYVLITSNDDYKGENEVSPDNVYIYLNCDEETASQKIKGEKYDGGFVSAQTFNRQLNNEKKFMSTAFSDTVWAYCFNLNDSYIKNESIRTAFTYAYDPSVIKPDSAYFEKTSRISSTYMTPSYEFTPKMNEYNETKASELYNLGLKNAELDSAAVTVLTTEDFAPQVKLQIQKWQKALGTDVKIKTDTLENVTAQVKNGSYQIAFCPVSYSSNKVYAMLGGFTSESSSNLMGYKSESYDALFDSVRTANGAQAKIEIYKQLEQKLIDDCVLLPVLTQNSYFVLNSSVSGIYALSQSEVYFINGKIKQ